MAPPHANGFRSLEEQIPAGWRECPPYGSPLLDCLIPSKTPLGRRYDPVLEPRHRYGPCTAKEELARHNITVGMMIDLTNSSRYYDTGELPGPPFLCFKVPCRGRGQSPSPEAVNEAAWMVHSFRSHHPDQHVIIHCTHGFNRTGYVIACIMVRMMQLKGFTIDRAIRHFAAARPPGIYKNAYINDLFAYHHEERDLIKIPVPREPAWKAAAGGEPDDDGNNDGDDGGPPQPAPTGQQVAGTEGQHIMHDDVIGEAVPQAEAEWVQLQVFIAVHGQPPRHGGVRFPGSQPVSLDHEHMMLLQNRRYWVTWKADGTRFMLWIESTGVYLMNRNFEVRRVQMRFPRPRSKSRPGEHVVGPPHHGTLLDGEMVVDMEQPGVYTRRFLVYDVVQLNQESLVQRPFKDRFEAIRDTIIDPRSKEREAIQRKAVAFRYHYELELFSVRRKEFWPVNLSHKLIYEMIPKLCHESDGLIFQGYEDPYIAGTCEELLKWKFSQHNSVDFKLECRPPPRIDPASGRPVLDNPEGYTLYLLNTRRSGNTPSMISIDDVVRNQRPPAPSNRVDWMHSSAAENHLKIVECAYELDRQVWRFMRVRTDKATPNAQHVFLKVFRAIQQNIREEEVLSFVKSAFVAAPVYHADREKLPPEALAALQQEVYAEQQAAQEQQHHQHHQQQHHFDPQHQPPSHHHRGNHDAEAGPHHGGGGGWLPPPPPVGLEQQQWDPAGRPAGGVRDEKVPPTWSGRPQWRPSRPIPDSPVYVPTDDFVRERVGHAAVGAAGAPPFVAGDEDDGGGEEEDDDDDDNDNGTAGAPDWRMSDDEGAAPRGGPVDPQSRGAAEDGQRDNGSGGDGSGNSMAGVLERGGGMVADDEAVHGIRSDDDAGAGPSGAVDVEAVALRNGGGVSSKGRGSGAGIGPGSSADAAPQQQAKGKPLAAAAGGSLRASLRGSASARSAHANGSSGSGAGGTATAGSGNVKRKKGSKAGAQGPQPSAGPEDGLEQGAYGSGGSANGRVGAAHVFQQPAGSMYSSGGQGAGERMEED